jgi:hypothetical protein
MQNTVNAQLYGGATYLAQREVQIHNNFYIILVPLLHKNLSKEVQYFQ